MVCRTSCQRSVEQLEGPSTSVEVLRKKIRDIREEERENGRKASGINTHPTDARSPLLLIGQDTCDTVVCAQVELAEAGIRVSH